MKRTTPIYGRFFIIGALCILFFTPVKAQYFIDENFYYCLMNTPVSTCLCCNNELTLPCPQLDSVQSLDCTNYDIHSLAGINLFTNLDSLNIYNNNIEDSITDLPASITYLNCSDNYFLTKINVPPNLSTLIWSSCLLNELPPLPPTLRYLDCSYDQFDTLPGLPASLQYFNCAGNYHLQSIPELPSTLQNLIFGSDSLPAIPALPATLTYLDCSQNIISGDLPVFPNTLDTLIIGYNYLKGTLICPPNLTYLDCQYDTFSRITLSSDLLQYLNCTSNNLSNLPPVAQLSALNTLIFDQNHVTSLPGPLSSTLNTLTFENNLVRHIPALPSTLVTFDCSYNPIDSLPDLPTGLQALTCYACNLTHFPGPLPDSLLSLYCDYNNLTSLPLFPPNFDDLTCSVNNLGSLPDFPQQIMMDVVVDSNPQLKCMPVVAEIEGFLEFEGTAISCLPDEIQLDFGYSVPDLSTVPLCSLNNPNGCVAGWNIQGTVMLNQNFNCNDTSGISPLAGLSVFLYDSAGINNLQIATTDSNGLFSFQTGLGTFLVTPDTNTVPYGVLCPGGGYFSHVTASDSFDTNANFQLACYYGHDFAIASVADGSGFFYPGDSVTIFINAFENGNFCTPGDAATITVVLSGPVSYAGPYVALTFFAETPDDVIGDTITWDITNFQAFNQLGYPFGFNIVTDSSAQAGDVVCINVSVAPDAGITDYDSTNNAVTQCYQVTNSHDPNGKEVYPYGLTDTSVHWLTYTIQYQNTGNVTAQNIVIYDTLDNNLDPTTFELISDSYLGSGFPNPQINGSVVRFDLSGINLPDTGTDRSASTGYLEYRVKLKNNLPIGTTISNAAFIYFDLNPPVITNTTLNTIFVNVPTTAPAVAAINAPAINLFPNPSTGLLNIAATGFVPQWLSIYDVAGKKVIEQPYTRQINISNLTSGIYFVEVKNDDIAVRKMIARQ